MILDHFYVDAVRACVNVMSLVFVLQFSSVCLVVGFHVFFPQSSTGNTFDMGMEQSSVFVEQNHVNLGVGWVGYNL